MWGALADTVLAVHVGIVAFVVGGLPLILVGNLWMGWPWVNSLAFRLAHLAAIATVVAESWLGVTCPLTTWEMALRARAQDSTYAGSFMAHWLQRLLYYDAPPWVFTAAYSLFALLVVLAWWRFPPHRGRSRPEPRRRGRTARAEPRP